MSRDGDQFPTFFRNKNKIKEGIEFSKEIDTGQERKILSDGRSLVLEYWYDCETGLDLVTAFYSSLGIEEWNITEHKAYLVSNNIMNIDNRDPSAFIFKDDAENLMWSVNWAEEHR